MKPIEESTKRESQDLVSAELHLILIGFSESSASKWLKAIGREDAPATRLHGTEWMDSTWMSKRDTGRSLAMVRYSSESFENEMDLCRCITAVTLGYRPTRLAVILPRVETRIALQVVRAGANIVFTENQTLESVRTDLENGGVNPGEFFGDANPWLDSLERVSELLLLDGDPRARLRSLLRVFVSRLGVDRGSIAFAEGNRLEIAAIVGEGVTLHEGMGSEIQPNSITATVMKNRRARLIQGSVAGGASSVRSAICAPLVSRETVLGVVNFSSFTHGRVLVENDVRAAELFASLVALSIDNQRMLDRTVEMERLSTVGTAMASVSHSLKNLLTVFRGGTDILERQLEKQDLTGAISSFRIVQSGVQRVENLVMELLSYSRKREPVIEKADLNELIEDLGRSFERARPNNRRTFETILDVEPVQLVDNQALERALLNLILNSVDATRDDGAIRLRIGKEGENLLFEVSDDGPGVPPEKLESIFEPFFSTKGSRGTGLGLSTVRKFAEENGGTASAAICSELGGLKITIALPIRQTT